MELRRLDRKGSAYIMMICLITLTWAALAATLLTLAAQGRTANRMQMSAVAMGLAEGGAAKALWESARGAGYKGEEDTPLGDGTFSVSVKREGGQVVITATGWVPRKSGARFSQSVRVVASPGGGVASWQKL
jgi:hypothetical protein